MLCTSQLKPRPPGICGDLSNISRVLKSQIKNVAQLLNYPAGRVEILSNFTKL